MFFVGLLILSAFAFLSYILPLAYQLLVFKVQNFRLIYGKEDDAPWALVTGGSSGIGKAIVDRLLAQGVNTVVVALDDQLLRNMKAEYENPKNGKKPECVKMRWIGVDLGSVDPKVYMDPIKENTADIQIRMLFNNAGFILPGIFHMIDIGKHMGNYHCNATAAVLITHHFLKSMANFTPNHAGKRGLITFTSSSAGFLPTPISALYGATKCFLTTFACSIGAEVKEDGIDVLCIHPSPTQSNFYDNARGISLLTAFQKTAVTPDTVAIELFKAAGRCFVRDLGYFSVGTKLLLKMIDWNFMAELTPLFMKSNADFRKLKAGSPKIEALNHEKKEE